MNRLGGRVALVTGGASGLGLAIARRLAEEGAVVVISDIDVAAGEALASAESWSFVRHDVCDEAGWDAAMRAVEVRHGRLDILVNNAGITGPVKAQNPEAMPFADWQNIFRVNADSVFLGCRAAIRVMRARGTGSIVNMSSVAAMKASPMGAAYGASKAVVRHLTKSVAQYCAAEGLAIRCNSVHPGNVHTPLWDKLARDFAEQAGVDEASILARVAAETPMGDLTRPEDVAAMVAFLVSDDARHVTGAAMIVDGGIVNCDSFHTGPGARYRLQQTSSPDRGGK